MKSHRVIAHGRLTLQPYLRTALPAFVWSPYPIASSEGFLFRIAGRRVAGLQEQPNRGSRGTCRFRLEFTGQFKDCFLMDGEFVGETG